MDPFMFRGIYLPEERQTAKSEVIDLPLPERVRIPLGGCKAAVKTGDRVRLGQRIGQGQTPVYSSVSGWVRELSELTTAEGTEQAVTIEPDKSQTEEPGLKAPVINSREQFIEAVRLSGCVGLSGSGKPTWEKLGFSEGADTLIINGMECEPYLTSDYHCILDKSADLMTGIKHVMHWMGIEKALFAVGKDKTRAVRRVEKICGEEPGITPKVLPARYPLGADRILAYKLTGRLVRENEELWDKKLLVMNVSTLAFIGGYLKTGMPLVRRTVTVDGDVVKTPCVINAPIGAPISALLSMADANMEAAESLVIGGPMMGIPVTDPEIPVTRTTNGVLAFMKPLMDKSGLVDGVGNTACIRCGKCMKACPMGLMPMRIERAVENKNMAKKTAALKRLRADLCFNCGACSYVCPAKRDPAARVRLAQKLIAGGEE